SPAIHVDVAASAPGASRAIARSGQRDRADHPARIGDGHDLSGHRAGKVLSGRGGCHSVFVCFCGVCGGWWGVGAYHAPVARQRFGASGLTRTTRMAEADIAANQARFEVRVTADSHFAWLRTRLAVERTMMSWVRTAVSLIGFGFAIEQFFER